MPYATIDDVQNRLPKRTWDYNAPDHEPSSTTVNGWLDEDAAWIGLQLVACDPAWLAEEPALTVLKDVNAGLTAARVRDFKFPDADAQERYADVVRAEAKERLAQMVEVCQAQFPDPGTDGDGGVAEGLFRSLKVQPCFTTGLQELTEEEVAEPVGASWGCSW
jgi:hypothetical protein